MGDLDLGPEPLDLAADGAAGADRVLAFQVRPVALEPGQGQEARLVPGADLPRLAQAGGRLVGVDADYEGLDLPVDGAVDRGGGAASSQGSQAGRGTASTMRTARAIPGMSAASRKCAGNTRGSR